MTESDDRDTIADAMLEAHRRRMQGYTPVIMPATPCDRSRNGQRTGRSTARRRRANR